MIKSYYEILNVAPDATKQEIKKQYKKLARIYHPDISKSLEAEEIFKEINKAVEILLDDEKRRNYDNLRKVNSEIYKNFSYRKQTSPKSNYTFFDLFSKNSEFNEVKKENYFKPIDGDDIVINVSIDIKEALFGTKRQINIQRSVVCPCCGGRKFANGKKCSYCDGLGEKNESKKITVKIPSSIKNNTKLRIKNEGQYGKFGGKNGNLYVIVKIEENEELTIENNTVKYTAVISPYTAVLGGDIQVPTIWGEAVIKIPPLTKANQSFKLIDVGLLDEKTNKKGDEIVKILIQIPSDISQEEYQLYERLKEINLKKQNAKNF